MNRVAYVSQNYGVYKLGAGGRYVLVYIEQIVTFVKRALSREFSAFYNMKSCKPQKRTFNFVYYNIFKSFLQLYLSGFYF